jgi:hypothetical protein
MVCGYSESNILSSFFPGRCSSYDLTCPAHHSRKATSDIFYRAGGHWRSHALETDSEQRQWDMETYSQWLDVIDKERNDPDQKLLSGLAVSQNLCLVAFAVTRLIFSNSIYCLADIETASQI